MRSYQRRLVITINLGMACIMALSGLSFLFAPNQAAFHRILIISPSEWRSVIEILPLALGILSLIFALGYVTLIDSAVEELHPRRQRTVFFILSFPLLIFLISLALSMLSDGTFNFFSLGYFALLLILWMAGSAVYSGYSQALEIASGILLSILMFILMLTFPTHTPQGILVFGLHGYGFGTLCLIGSIMYMLLFYPRVRRLSQAWKRFYFIVAEVPIGLFAFLETLYAIKYNHPTLFFAVFLWALFFMISALGSALYRPLNAQDKEIS